jgi:hypothetical protein
MATANGLFGADVGGVCVGSTPTRVFPNSKSRWPEGLGQLTALGLKQMFELGETMRERYVHRFGLLSPRYHADEVWARSTSKDRTLMSAHVRADGSDAIFAKCAASRRISHFDT